MDPFTVSVCICTRNRPDDLRKALASVRQSYSPITEIIVSDDSTDFRSRDLVRVEFPEAIYLEGPRKGLGANRNTCLSRVTASHVLFIDDDVILSSDFFCKVTRYLEQSHEQEDITRIIVTGIELKCGVRIFPRRASFLGFQSIAYGPSDILSSIVINATVFPSALFKAVQFDENLVYGCEELDMACMAVHAGFSIHLLESAINYHYPSPINRDSYRAYTDASRIFVTFKRYRMLQRNRAKASFFLIAAYSHNLLFNLKQRGVRGLRAFFTTLSLSRAYMEALLSNPVVHDKKA